MFIVGLTGGIGSGKTAASNLFIARGIVVVDADIVAREVVMQGSGALQEIHQHFGPSILLADGSLDRANLRQIIFSHPDEKLWLEALLHPIIRNEIIQQLNDAKSPYVILSSPLLLETEQHRLCQRILLVDVPESLQIQRATERDSNSAEQIKAIIAAQGSRQFKQSNADDIIDNSTDLAHLEKQVEQQHQRYLDLTNQYESN